MSEPTKSNISIGRTFPRQIGSGVRVIAALVGTLGVLSSILLCFLNLWGGLLLLVFCIGILAVGISGNPRTWLTWGGTGDPEWDSDITDGTAPSPKYTRYSWLDYAMIVGMLVSGAILLPIWNYLGMHSMVDTGWQEVALVFGVCIVFNAFWWQVKSTELDGIGTSLFGLLLGLAIIAIGSIWQPMWMPTMAGAIIFCSAWGALRKYLIAKFHMIHMDADR